MHLMVNRESLSCMLQSNSDITLLNTIRYTGCNFTLQSICSINLPLEILYILRVFKCFGFLYFNSHSSKPMIYRCIVSNSKGS